MAAVVGGEEQRPAQSGQGGGVGTAIARAWVDVLDQDGAATWCRSTSTALGPGCRRRCGGEEQPPGKGGQVARAVVVVVGEADVLDQDGAGLACRRTSTAPWPPRRRRR